MTNDAQTTEQAAENPEGRQRAALAKLREPFPAHQVSLLPKQVRRDDQDRGKCDTSTGRKYSKDGRYCGGWHALSVHLDYVGHAALTDRLLEADPLWDWAPVSVDADGLPLFDRQGGLWIKLTVAGVTRLGYGDSQGKTGPNATKEAIGDALRNAGMRFGAALDLWHKGDLHDASEQQGTEDAPAEAPKPAQRRSAPPQGPNQSAPVSAPAPAAATPEAEHDWQADVDAQTTAQGVADVWAKARTAGALGVDCTWPGGEVVTLREYIKRIGAALNDAEAKKARGDGPDPEVLSRGK